MAKMSIRGISLNVKVVGNGYPLALMHGGPGADLYTMMAFRPLSKDFTLVFYDHRCNGRSDRAELTTMTMENLTADADALRLAMGFEKWAVLGHSFGGNVALEYALRYPQSLSHLILVDTGGDSRWSRENAPRVLAQRGFSPDIVDLSRRLLNGQIEPREMFPSLMKLGNAYNPYTGLRQLPHMIWMGLRVKLRPEALIFAASHLKGWTVMDRLGEIQAPTLVIAGREDFQFPPECQQELAGGIPNARLVIIDRAGHNPHDEQPAKVIEAIRRFLVTAPPGCAFPGPGRSILFPSLLVGSLLALALRLFARLSASRAPAKPAPKDTSYHEIDTYVEGQMRRLKIPGVSLAIVEGDRIAHLRGFGRARPGGEAPKPQTPFFIGSLTKSFTALAIMQLVEAGKVDLDAPVQRYLPWFRVADPQASAQMTVRHLLNQTSGLPLLPSEIALADFDDRPDAAERQVRALSTLKLARPVGAQFEYCNTNYNVLGLIVEAASGEPYAEYVQQHIFDPLEMRHSFTSKAAAQQDGLAVGYRYWFGFPIPAPDLSIPSGSLPSGQLISSAEDMAHYLIAHLNGGRYCGAEILSEARIEELTRGAAEINEMGLSLGSYGMGWIVERTGASRIVWHSGTVPDFGAIMALVPEQKKGLVLLFNANHGLMKMTYDEVGVGAAQLLAEERPTRTVFGLLHWVMRGLLLIPIFQIIGVAATFLLIKRWQVDPEHRPSRRRMWGQHILLPLFPNLLAALTLVPMLSKMRGWVRLFMPDFSWIAWISGGFAVIWSLLRTRLVLRALRK